jgi:hypothetical protein
LVSIEIGSKVVTFNKQGRNVAGFGHVNGGAVSVDKYRRHIHAGVNDRFAY